MTVEETCSKKKNILITTDSSTDRFLGEGDPYGENNKTVGITHSVCSICTNRRERDTGKGNSKDA